MKEQRRIMNHLVHERSAVALGAVLVLAGSLGLTACGSSSKSSTAATPTTTAPASSAAGTAAGTGNANFPGASGSVAALSGSSMEVQNQQTGQVTVSWKPSTRFTKNVTLSASSIKVGECVAVTGTTANSTISAARSVAISKPTGGTCTRSGRFGGSGGGGSGGAGYRFGGANNGFSFASGKVTSVSPSTLVLSGVSSSGAARAATAASTSSTTVANKTITISLVSSTTYSETESAKSSALAVGDCVNATGTTSSTGAVSASTIRITSTGAKSCTTGFGGYRSGGSGGGSTSG